jgi:hypothetical protein
MLGKPLVRFCEGSGYNSGHGRDIVAPLGNQAANRENKLRPKVWGVPDLLEGNLAMLPTVREPQ